MNFEQWMWQTWKRLDERPAEEVVQEYTQEEVRVVMAAAVQTLVDELVRGGGLSLSDLGQIKTLEQKPRRVVSNLRGGQVYLVEARRTVRFAPSRALIRRMNGADKRLPDGAWKLSLAPDPVRVY